MRTARLSSGSIPEYYFSSVSATHAHWDDANIPAFNFFFFFSFRLCGDDSWPNMSLGKWFAWTSVRAWSIHISLEKKKKEKILWGIFALDCRQNKFQFSSGAKRSLVRKNMCWCNIFPALFFYYQSIGSGSLRWFRPFCIRNQVDDPSRRSLILAHFWHFERREILKTSSGIDSLIPSPWQPPFFSNKI
jgi:hypothetical protein